MIENDKKICPMKFITENSFIQHPYCEKSKCAWWCEWRDCCALVGIAADIYDMGDKQ